MVYEKVAAAVNYAMKNVENTKKLFKVLSKCERIKDIETICYSIGNISAKSKEIADITLDQLIDYVDEGVITEVSWSSSNTSRISNELTEEFLKVIKDYREDLVYWIAGGVGKIARYTRDKHMIRDLFGIIKQYNDEPAGIISITAGEIAESTHNKNLVNYYLSKIKGLPPKKIAKVSNKIRFLIYKKELEEVKKIICAPTGI